MSEEKLEIVMDKDGSIHIQDNGQHIFFDHTPDKGDYKYMKSILKLMGFKIKDSFFDKKYDLWENEMKYKEYVKLIENAGKKAFEKQRMKGKFDLSPFVQDSIKNSVIEKTQSILSENEIITTEALQTKITVDLVHQMKAAMLYNKTHKETPTIVIPMFKKNYKKDFNFKSDNILGDLLRSSSLPVICKKLEEKWFSINKDDLTSKFSNVFYVPDVVVFLNNGKFIDYPFKVNVLLVAFPTKKYMEDSEVQITDQEVVSVIIADMMDAAIRLSQRNLIIDPFNFKYFWKDKEITTAAWKQISESKRFNTQIQDVKFTVPDESLFVTFNSVFNA